MDIDAVVFCERSHMAAKLSKKQRVALREIDKTTKDRKRDLMLGFGSIAVMALLIIGYNEFTYSLGIIGEDNTVIRGVLYGIAMVIAGFCGIMLMHASQKKNKIDGLRQQAGISRETLEAWKNGEYDE